MEQYLYNNNENLQELYGHNSHGLNLTEYYLEQDAVEIEELCNNALRVIRNSASSFKQEQRQIISNNIHAISIIISLSNQLELIRKERKASRNQYCLPKNREDFLDGAIQFMEAYNSSCKYLDLYENNDIRLANSDCSEEIIFNDSTISEPQGCDLSRVRFTNINEILNTYDQNLKNDLYGRNTDSKKERYEDCIKGFSSLSTWQMLRDIQKLLILCADELKAIYIEDQMLNLELIEDNICKKYTDFTHAQFIKINKMYQEEKKNIEEIVQIDMDTAKKEIMLLTSDNEPSPNSLYQRYQKLRNKYAQAMLSPDLSEHFNKVVDNCFFRNSFNEECLAVLFYHNRDGRLFLEAFISYRYISCFIEKFCREHDIPNKTLPDYCSRFEIEWDKALYRKCKYCISDNDDEGHGLSISSKQKFQEKLLIIANTFSSYSHINTIKGRFGKEETIIVDIKIEKFNELITRICSNDSFELLSSLFHDYPESNDDCPFSIRHLIFYIGWLRDNSTLFGKIQKKQLAELLFKCNFVKSKYNSSGSILTLLSNYKNEALFLDHKLFVLSRQYLSANNL